MCGRREYRSKVRVTRVKEKEERGTTIVNAIGHAIGIVGLTSNSEFDWWLGSSSCRGGSWSWWECPFYTFYCESVKTVD